MRGPDHGMAVKANELASAPPFLPLLVDVAGSFKCGDKAQAAQRIPHLLLGAVQVKFNVSIRAGPGRIDEGGQSANNTALLEPGRQRIRAPVILVRRLALFVAIMA